MADASQHWNLFGYDLRGAYQDWRAAWKELFWGERSWLRRSLGETVHVLLPETADEHYYRAGRQVAKQKCVAQACIVPDHLVLSRELVLPANVELELESLLALEVRSRSPFLAEDTRYGWHIEHENSQIKVYLFIASHSAIQGYLRQKELVELDLEVWTLVNKQAVVINGFGELPRYRRYRRQITWFVTGLMYCLLMLCLLITVPVAVKYLQLQKLEQQYVAVQHSSESAVNLRAQLRLNNDRAQNINQLVAGSSDPYLEIEQLSSLLDDTVWLSLINIKGDKIRMEGFAKNAAELMQKLSDQNRIEKVRSPAAIRFDNRTKRERFVMELSLRKSMGDEP